MLQHSKAGSGTMAIEFDRRAAARWLLRQRTYKLISLLACIGGCEIALRSIWHNPYRYEIPEYVLRLPIHHAYMDQVFDRARIDAATPTVRFRTDGRSYILPSKRFGRPDATVAFLGGSTTECSAVQEGLRFPAMASTLLERRGLRVNTLNAARSGNTLHDSLNVLINHVVEDKPDVVVLMVAANDIGVLAADASYRSRMGQPLSLGQALRWPLQEASASLYMAGVVRKAWAARNALQASAGSNGRFNESRHAALAHREAFAQRLRAFVRAAHALEMKPVVMTEPMANVRNGLTPAWTDAGVQETYNQIIRDVGLQEGAVVIDLVRYLAESVPDWDVDGRIFYDGLHVTDFGSQKYAEHIAERLRETVIGVRDVLPSAE